MVKAFLAEMLAILILGSLWYYLSSVNRKFAVKVSKCKM